MPAYNAQSAGFDAAAHKAAVGTIIELIELDASELLSSSNVPGSIQRVVSSHRVSNPVTFNGNIYAPVPFSSGGWEWTSNAPPRPSITVADGQGVLLATLREYNGLVNANDDKSQGKTKK